MGVQPQISRKLPKFARFFKERLPIGRHHDTPSSDWRIRG